MAVPAIDRAGDDGEPSGSAGRPILAQLVGRELVDTAVIVSRFWGGTKLGVGGLVRAYGGAAGEALDQASIARWTKMTSVVIVHQHGDTDAVTRCIATHGGLDTDVTYAAMVTRTVTVSADDVDALVRDLADRTAGRVVVDPADGDESLRLD